jgi:hypothetical protein
VQASQSVLTQTDVYNVTRQCNLTDHLHICGLSLTKTPLHDTCLLIIKELIFQLFFTFFGYCALYYYEHLCTHFYVDTHVLSSFGYIPSCRILGFMVNCLIFFKAATQRPFLLAAVLEPGIALSS